MGFATARLVRQRAGECCEYCRLPQAVSALRFHIEHIVARQHGGSEDAENLALACPECNLRKGPNLSGIDPDTGETTTLFHPRRDSWHDHFVDIEGRISGISPAGRATVSLLGMNTTDRCRLRQCIKLRTGADLPGWREALLPDDGLQQILRLVTMGELAMSFSDEVRNALTTLIGHAYMGQQALPEGDPIRNHLDSITRNSMRMKGMIDSMLNFGRKREETTDRCAPEELIHEAVRIAGPYLEDFKHPPIAVQVDVESECPKIAVTRWEMIHVLVNLLTNAADAMSESQQRLITIAAHREPQAMVRISVADTGSGIASENVGRIFTPFFTTKGERGNGLGLFIVRSTIEHHGGSITLQTGDSGTAFTIALPAL